jgi:hypothetical protein
LADTTEGDIVAMFAGSLSQREWSALTHLSMGLCRPSTPLMWQGFKDVDARNKCGHDESEILAAGISRRRHVYFGCGDYPTGKSLALLMALLISCPAPFAKIFCFALEANQFTESCRPFP